MIRYNAGLAFEILKIVPRQVTEVFGIQMTNYIFITLGSRMFRLVKTTLAHFLQTGIHTSERSYLNNNYLRFVFFVRP